MFTFLRPCICLYCSVKYRCRDWSFRLRLNYIKVVSFIHGKRKLEPEILIQYQIKACGQIKHQFSHSVMSWLSAMPWTAAHQASLSITNSRSLPQTHVQWVGDDIQTISSSVVPFSSCLQSFPASGGQRASASVLPVNIQDWFLLGWTGWISLLSKGLSTVFFNTKVQKHQFFSAQLSYGPTLTFKTWFLHFKLIFSDDFYGLGIVCTGICITAILWVWQYYLSVFIRSLKQS